MLHSPIGKEALDDMHVLMETQLGEKDMFGEFMKRFKKQHPELSMDYFKKNLIVACPDYHQPCGKFRVKEKGPE